MTSRPSDEAERAAAIASLQRTQVLLRETLASGDVPVDEEIRVRTQIGVVLVSSCDQLQHQPFVHDAIHHLETVLRRASYVSGKYPMYLTSLSKARTSEYMMTGSSRALDLAVESVRQALELAVENDLQSLDFEAQIDIVSSLGFALSRRHALSEKLDDLDEAIVYTRMVYDGATKGSDRYIMGLNDLVSQLHRRIEQAHDDDLEQEAERLVKELAASTTPGTLQHAMAVRQLGFIESKKFKATKSLEHLDQSLKYCKTAFEALPQHHETRLDILNMIIDLYSARRGRLKDVTDLGTLVHYSGLLLEALPIGHPSRGSHLLGHIQRVQEYATEYNPQDKMYKTVHLIATPAPLNLNFDVSKWNTRGWTFQERLLSRRCLYFAKSDVYFQCSQHTLSETGMNDEYAAFMLDKTPLKPKLTSVRAARDNPLNLLSPLQDTTIEERDLRTFGIYKDLSETYSELTAATFAHALLWTPAGRLPRRGMRLPTPADFSLGKPHSQFSSWPWVSWDGPVEYHVFLSHRDKFATDYGCEERAYHYTSDHGHRRRKIMELQRYNYVEPTDGEKIGDGVDKTTKDIPPGSSTSNQTTNNPDISAEYGSTLKTGRAVPLNRTNIAQSQSWTTDSPDMQKMNANVSELSDGDQSSQASRSSDTQDKSPRIDEAGPSASLAHDDRVWLSLLTKEKELSTGDIFQEKIQQGSFQNRRAAPPKPIKIQIVLDPSRGTTWTVGGPQPMEPRDSARDDNTLKLQGFN
ncbi:hypothetical protein SCUP515_12015 [Seiridium cupressi]